MKQSISMRVFNFDSTSVLCGVGECNALDGEREIAGIADEARIRVYANSAEALHPGVCVMLDECSIAEGANQGNVITNICRVVVQKTLPLRRIC